MEFDDILLEILSECIDDKKVNVENYIKKYPQYKEQLLAKLKTADFIRKNLQDEDFSGRQFGDYVILQELGRGGMGIVFLAIQPSLSRLVTLKILPPSFSYDKEALENFQEEAKIIAKFNHPNIVPIYSYGNEKSVYYIAMGYVAGISLKELIEKIQKIGNINNIKAKTIKEIVQKAPIQEQEIVQESISLKRSPTFWNKSYVEFIATIGSEISEAISYAHQYGIFHGDIKPSNILLTNELIPMVVDFGLSRDIKKLSKSKSKEFSGTLAYASPEQIQNNTINEKTDMWSLGLTLYELLTLKNPFREDTVQKTVNRITKYEPLPLKHFNRRIPIEVEAIIFKCLEKDSQKRYRSIAELTQDLKYYLETKPILAKPDGIIKRTRKAIRRRPIVAVLTILSFLLLICFSIAGSNNLISSTVDEINTLMNQGKFEEAFAEFNRLEKLAQYHPYARQEFPSVCASIGYHYYLLNDFKKMGYWFDKALAKDSNNFEARVGLGRYYSLVTKEYSKALSEFKIALDMAPRFTALHEDIANILYMQGIRSSQLEEIVAYLFPYGYIKEQIADIYVALLYAEAMNRTFDEMEKERKTYKINHTSKTNENRR